ncbi:hypothetical protein ACF0H5_010293 [Mactra antiquata]
MSDSIVDIGDPTSVPTRSASSGYGFVHESFPPGNLSRNGRRLLPHRRVIPENSFIMTGSRLFTRKDGPEDRRVNVLFPCMVSDPNSQNNRKGPKCAFTYNQKNYLRMKGIKISDAYSLNRNHSSRAKHHIQYCDKPSLSDLDLPRLMNSAGVKEKLNEKDTSKIWRPNNSRKVLTGNPMYARFIKGHQNEAGVFNHTRTGDVGNRRLGNVLTLQHLHEILAEEKPIIPKTFYTDS